jgi:hypothetical protein
MCRRNRLCLQLQLDKSHDHVPRSDTRATGRRLGYGSLPIPWDSLTCVTFCVCFLRMVAKVRTAQKNCALFYIGFDRSLVIAGSNAGARRTGHLQNQFDKKGIGRIQYSISSRQRPCRDSTQKIFSP